MQPPTYRASTAAYGEASDGATFSRRLRGLSHLVVPVAAAEMALTAAGLAGDCCSASPASLASVSERFKAFCCFGAYATSFE